MKSLRKLSLLWFLAALVPQPALAQSALPGAAVPAKSAEQLYREGMELVGKQKWAEAEAKFRQAFELNPTYDAAANLGHTEQKLGKYRDAAEHLSFAIRNWPIAGKREPRDLAVKTLDELRALVGTLTVEASVPGALVSVNGRSVARAPIAYELFVDPGAVSVEAKFEGYETAQRSLTAEKGKRYEVKLALQKPPAMPSATASAVPMTSASPLPQGPRKEVIVTGVALTGAGLVVGLATGVAALGAAADAQKQLDGIRLQQPCKSPADSAVCKSVQAKLTEQDALTNTAFWSLVGAGVAGVATVIYVIAARPAKTSSGVVVVPVAGTTGGGLTIIGRF